MLFLPAVAAMKFNENLQELYLGSNHLTTEDGQHLGSILRTNHTLRVMDLRENNLGDSGVRFICAGIAEQQEGLHVLNLTSNSIGQEGFHHISAMLVCLYACYYCGLWSYIFLFVVCSHVQGHSEISMSPIIAVGTMDCSCSN